MFGTAIKYGAISGALIIGVLVSGITISNGEHGNGHIFSSVWFGYLVMLLALSTIFIAIREHRSRLGGVIKFLPALGLGLLIALIAAVAYVIGWEFYLNATGHQFMNAYVAQMIEAKRAAGVTGAELARFVAEMEAMKVNYANPLYRLPMTFAEIFPVGVLIALISAAVLRNPKVLPARG